MTQAQIDLQKQAQIDLQKQLEHATADLTTILLLNDSPVLYIDTSDQISSTPIEQINRLNKQKTNLIIQKFLFHLMTMIIHTTHRLLQKSEIMKDPVFLSSSIYPPFIP